MDLSVQPIAFVFDCTNCEPSRMVHNLFVQAAFVQSYRNNFGDLFKEILVTYGDVWSKDVSLADYEDGIYNPE